MNTEEEEEEGENLGNIFKQFPNIYNVRRIKSVAAMDVHTRVKTNACKHRRLSQQPRYPFNPNSV